MRSTTEVDPMTVTTATHARKVLERLDTQLEPRYAYGCQSAVFCIVYVTTLYQQQRLICVKYYEKASVDLERRTGPILFLRILLVGLRNMIQESVPWPRFEPGVG
jgi:hypothetical protein